MKTALVYDHLNKKGGAEEILQTLNQLWPQSKWFTSVYDPKKISFSSDWNVQPSIINKLPYLKNHHELIPFLMPFAFESFDLDQYELVISTSSSAAKGIITQPSTLHINYCLTPTRYLWSHQKEYLDSSQYRLLKKLLNPLTHFVHNKLQQWDKVAAHRPDNMISISEHVKKRVKKYYNIDTDVVYPPVDVNKFKEKGMKPPESDYYLVVSRLVPYKKIDLLIKAFNKSAKTLVIVGIGADSSRLKRMANKNIIFKGYLEDDKLVGYYQHCTAFLQANEEDFGIAMVEAQAAGKPVIAYNLGGASEIVENGKTGVLVKEQKIDSFLQAVDKTETINISKEACRANAESFSRDNFKKIFSSKVNELWIKHQKANLG